MTTPPADDAPAAADPPQLDVVSGLGPTFDQAAVAALDPWRLGDLLPCPPLAWAALAGLPDSVTGRVATAGSRLAVEQLTVPDRALAMVCSQTCDVVGAGPGARFAFVQVSPVFDFTGDDTDWDRLVRGEVWHAFGIEGRTGTPRRVVDLRISVPVSKQVLISTERRFGFADPLDAQRLAGHLAGRAQRAALHDFLSGHVRAAVASAVDKRKTQHKWLQGVREVRLSIEGDHLKPKAAGLFLVWHTRWTDEQLDAAFRFGLTLRTAAREAGIAWKDTQSMHESDPGVIAYRESVRLYLPALNVP